MDTATTTAGSLLKSHTWNPDKAQWYFTQSEIIQIVNAADGHSGKSCSLSWRDFSREDGPKFPDFPSQDL